MDKRLWPCAMVLFLIVGCTDAPGGGSATPAVAEHCNPPDVGDPDCFANDTIYAQFKRCVLDTGDRAACLAEALGESSGDTSCVDSPPPEGVKACFATRGEYTRYKACIRSAPDVPNRKQKCYDRRNHCASGMSLVEDVCQRQCPENSRMNDDGDCEPVPPPCPQGEGWQRDPNTWHCSEIPHPVPPQPATPTASHFQFDYIIRPLTIEQVNRIRAGVLDMTTLIDRPTCRFVATNVSTVGALNMRNRGSLSDPVFSISLDLQGGSPNCAAESVIRFMGELRDMEPGHNGRANLDDDPIAVVRTNAQDYLMWFGWYVQGSGTIPPVIYQNWNWPVPGNPSGRPFVASFEFLAERLTEEYSADNEYLLGFYGTADVP